MGPCFRTIDFNKNSHRLGPSFLRSGSAIAYLVTLHVATAKYNSHTDPIFKRFKVLKLTDAYHLQCCKLFYKKKIRTLHSYHASRLLTAEPRRTRQWNDVIISRHTSIFQTQSFNYKIGHSWNTLPFEIKTIESLCEKSFAGTIKKLFLSRYSEKCTDPHCYCQL